MTKSKMRRLQFQRKYTSNEDYEKDKETAIRVLTAFNFRHAVDVLNQSKWIGVDDMEKAVEKVLREEKKND